MTLWAGLCWLIGLLLCSLVDRRERSGERRTEPTSTVVRGRPAGVRQLASLVVVGDQPGDSLQ
jgi:hypothetical protein